MNLIWRQARRHIRQTEKGSKNEKYKPNRWRGRRKVDSTSPSFPHLTDDFPRRCSSHNAVIDEKNVAPFHLCSNWGELSSHPLCTLTLLGHDKCAIDIFVLDERHGKWLLQFGRSRDSAGDAGFWYWHDAVNLAQTSVCALEYFFNGGGESDSHLLSRVVDTDAVNDTFWTRKVDKLKDVRSVRSDGGYLRHDGSSISPVRSRKEDGLS
jgi:hypothetical protein